MSSGNGQVRVLARSWPQATQGERQCLTAGRGLHAVHGGKRKRFNGGVRERLARGLGRPQRRASLRRPRGRRTRSERRGSGRLPPRDRVCTCNNGRTFTVAFACPLAWPSGSCDFSPTRTACAVTVSDIDTPSIWITSDANSRLSRYARKEAPAAIPFRRVGLAARDLPTRPRTGPTSAPPSI